MKKIASDISMFLLLFLFSLFAISNIGFLLHFSINPFYIPISFLIASVFLFKSGDFLKKIFIVFIIFIASFILSNLFIDTSFDGRCYHFTTENLLRLGYNPFFNSNLKDFASNHNIFYNLLFSGSYPNAAEVVRANFYLIFQNMESSKIVNFLFIFAGALYSFYFFLNRLKCADSILLSICVLLCSVSICQMNTKMIDFILYYLFCFQLFSILLINEDCDKKNNFLVLIMASSLAIGTKYTGAYSTLIMLFIFLIYKFNYEKLKAACMIIILSAILCAQPYILNLVKHQSPFYPSIGKNKTDFMTKQNPIEFQNKPYLYKFIRSIFSSASDARMNNPQTPKLYWKMPFSAHYDMPFGAEDIRISGFGHLFSGIFLLSLLFSAYLIYKRKGLVALALIYSTVLLNPVCWWARFVPQLHLLPVIICYYIEKKRAFFYILCGLILLNGAWVMRENIAVTAYKTFVMNNFYNDLYEKSKTKKIQVFIDKTPYDENDSTILERMKEYGVDFEISDTPDKNFVLPKTDCTITDSYRIFLP